MVSSTVLLLNLGSGIVGATFNFEDKDNFMLFEISPSFARLRKKFRGVYSTITRSSLWSFKPGAWNTIELSFSGSHVVINAGQTTTLPAFSVGRTDGPFIDASMILTEQYSKDKQACDTGP